MEISKPIPKFGIGAYVNLWHNTDFKFRTYGSK